MGEFGEVFRGVLQIARAQVADARVVLGEVARRRGAVFLDHVEEARAVGVAQQRQFEIRVLSLETDLCLGDHLGGFLGTRLNDQRTIAENERGEDEQAEENIPYRPAVLLEKELRFVHCFAEGFLFGDVLLCHIAYSCY